MRIVGIHSTLISTNAHIYKISQFLFNQSENIREIMGKK